MVNSWQADICCTKGKAFRRRVETSSDVPDIWQQFFCIDDNNTELFSFLTSNIVDTDTNKYFITTITYCHDVSASSAMHS